MAHTLDRGGLEVAAECFNDGFAFGGLVVAYTHLDQLMIEQFFLKRAGHGPGKAGRPDHDHRFEFVGEAAQIAFLAGAEMHCDFPGDGPLRQAIVKGG